MPRFKYFFSYSLAFNSTLWLSAQRATSTIWQISFSLFTMIFLLWTSKHHRFTFLFLIQIMDCAYWITWSFMQFPMRHSSHPVMLHFVFFSKAILLHSIKIELIISPAISTESPFAILGFLIIYTGLSIIGLIDTILGLFLFT